MARCETPLTWRILVKFVALIVLAFTGMNPAAATDLPIQGGPGGGMFRDDCPAGQYLIGTNARTGFVVDAISITCAAVKDDGTVTSPPSQDPDIRGGPGGSAPKDPFTGNPRKTTCNDSEIINAMGLLTGSEPPHTVIRLIIFNCVSTTGDARHNLDIGDAPLFPTIQQNCPAGQAATGIQGRFGTYVDALGLICGPFTKRTPAGAGPGPTADGCAGLSGDEATICKEHNVLRAKHGVPGLTWSTDLAKNAKDWVAGCHTQKNANGDEFFCHQNKDFGCGTDASYHYGENLSWFSGTPQLTPDQVVDGWYCEISVYDFDHPKLTGGVMFGCDNNPNKVTGHFTQVVWKASQRLGCAKNSCPLGGNDATLWACEYDPPGNFNADQPGVLQQNVPRPIQGLVATHQLRLPPPQTTTAIISDVDLYDVPGGVGRVIGILRRGQKFPLKGCRADDWCQLSEGWVWGSFITRNHNRPYSEIKPKQ